MTKVTSLYSSTKIMIIAESEYFLGQNWIFTYYEYKNNLDAKNAEEFIFK